MICMIEMRLKVRWKSEENLGFDPKYMCEMDLEGAGVVEKLLLEKRSRED